MDQKDDLDYLLPSNGPNPYYDTWDRHNSIAFSTATKGLHNAPGENNCFVNSAVQVFWHLDVFRRSYRRLSGHTCMGNSCIFCALKVIFTQFQFSDQSSLHPDALRKALADTFANQQRFQLGHMDDAAECFENILKRIHFHIAHNHPEDTCNAPHCLPHQKFSLGIVEKVVCPCGASSKPFQYREMVHYISVSALVSQAQLMQESGDVLHPDRFGLLLRNANALGDIRQCPGSCGKTVQIRRTLLNIPDVVSIGLGWDSDHPTMEMTTKVAKSIGTAILLQDVFHSVSQDMSSLPKLQLVGLVCYYCKHYSTFVFHSKLGVWIYFDDTTVKEIGPSFDHVVDKCSRGRYQPLLLLYANPNSTPVPVDSAPKKRVMAPGFYLPGSEDENTLDRTHESISSQSSSVQRTMTPNPEPSNQIGDPSSSYPRARSVTPSSGSSHHHHHHHDAATIRKEAPSPSVGISSSSSSDHSRQQSFIMAMAKADAKNSRHPLRMGGQSGITGMGGMPGPMTPVKEQEVLQQKDSNIGGPYHQTPHHPHNHHYQQQTGSAFHRPDQQPQTQTDPHNTSYADYTLSNNNQYKRPSLTGFTPDDLPLTPNQKGNNNNNNNNNNTNVGDSPRKESFKRNKEPIRADIIRHPSDSSSKQLSTTGYNNNNYQDIYSASQQQQMRTNVRSSAMFYQGPGSGNHQFRQRSLSQGGDEAYASDSSEYNRPVTEHVVVKPTAGGNMGDNDDINSSSYTHTAVQSGLATLPRKKKNQTVESTNTQHFRPVPTSQYYPKEDNNNSMAQRHTPVMDNSALPPMGPGRVISPLIDQVDSSVIAKKSSGKDEAEKEKKLMKKVKKESKKLEKKKVKSYPNATAVETALMTRSASADIEDNNDDPKIQANATMDGNGISEDQNQSRYINRNMVASVLKHQGLQRQPSTHSTNSQTSNSSVESEGIMNKLLAAKAHHGGAVGDASFDNVSLGSHKDSGYGSSDRNSSSSTGSGTIDPSVQYFLSKSMVIPRNFNSQMFERQSQQFVTDFTAPTPHVYPSQYVGQGQGEGHHDVDRQGGQQTVMTMSAEDKNRLGYQAISQRKVMHPIKESSQEDMLKIMPKEVLEAAKAASRSSPVPDALLQGKEGGRPPPIPPKNFAAFQVSKSAHQREPSIDSLDKDEVTNDYFVSMCEKADDLMDRCILAETQENLPDALRYCDSALGCLKEAMNQTDIEKKAAIYAQKKHKSCLLKSRSLFKRVSSQTTGDGHSGKRSSITSTDSDNSDKLVRRAPSKERLMASAAGKRLSSSNISQHQRHQQDACNSSLDSTGSGATRHSPMPGSQVPEGMHVKGMVDQRMIMTQGLRYDAAVTSPPSSNLVVSDSSDKLLPKSHHVSRAQMMDRSDSSSNHSRSGSNSSVRSSVSVPSALSSQQQQSTAPPPPPLLPKSQSCIASSISAGVSGPVPLDAYGTLSRNRKPRRTSDPTGKTGDSYQMFVTKQKHLQVQIQHTTSDRGGSTTDSRDSDSNSNSSSNDGGANPQRRTSKAEIRELLENNFVQQQKQQLIMSSVSGGGGGGPGSDQKNGIAVAVTRSRHSYEGSGSSTTMPSPSSSSSSPLSPSSSVPLTSVHQTRGQVVVPASAMQSQSQNSSAGVKSTTSAVHHPRYSNPGIYPPTNQARNSPVPMATTMSPVSHDQGMTTGATRPVAAAVSSTNVVQAARLHTTSPTPHQYPYHHNHHQQQQQQQQQHQAGQMKQQQDISNTSNTQYHHERSHSQQQYTDNACSTNNPNSYQRPLSSLASPASSSPSSSSASSQHFSQRSQQQTHPATPPSSSSSLYQQQYPSPSSSSHPPQNVSGYNQPLPGHRIPPSSSNSTSMRPNSYTTTIATTTTTNSTNITNNNPRHITSPTSSSQPMNYPHPLSSTTSSSQHHFTPHSSSQQSNNYTTHPNQAASQSQPGYNNPSVQGSNPTAYNSNNNNNNTPQQNLSSPPSKSHQPAFQDPRRPAVSVGGAQPPPPPARTTSNPDFRDKLQLLHHPGGNNNNQQSTSFSSHQYPNSQHHQQQQNIARVQPNSHLSSSSSSTPHPQQTQYPEIPLPPSSSSSSLQQSQHHRYRPGSISTDINNGPPAPPNKPPTTNNNSSNRYSFVSTSFSSQSGSPANGGGGNPGIGGTPSSQLKHAYSSTGLHTIAASLAPMAPRPLERCTSQPDCQNLPGVDPYQPSSERDGSSFPSPLSHSASHPANTNTVVHLEPGQSTRFGTPTSDAYHQNNMEERQKQPSVRDLMSRFDHQPNNSNFVKPAVKPKPSSTARNRSKSESASKKPKSVLKSKKAKSANGKSSRKSVTFAQDFSEKASGYESAAELTSFSSSAPINDRAYFSDDEEHLGSRTSYYGNEAEDVEVDSSNSDEAPPPEELACQLCHKREIEPGRAYCSKCYFYMSRLTN